MHRRAHLHGAGDAMPPPSIPQRICHSPLGVSLQTPPSACCQVQSLHLDVSDCRPADIRNCGGAQHAAVLTHSELPQAGAQNMHLEPC